MSGDRLRAAVQNAETPMLRAYREWVEHGQKCVHGCKGAAKAEDGCPEGRRLWGTYRLRRINRGTR